MPRAVAALFAIEESAPVWVCRRTTTTTTVDGRPRQLADSYYPLDLAVGTLLTEENSGPGGGFARLDEAGDRKHSLSVRSRCGV